MNMTATTAAAQRARMGTTVKTSIRSVAAAVALAAAAILFAAPEADARPPKDTEDAIAAMKADCYNAKGTFKKVTDRDYSCTLPFKNGRQDQWNMDNLGNTRSICYRFSVDTAWVCQ